ncbi:hypothetical protein GCM10022220_43710 [Actinocatenispora rupis]|uniref:Uncharacterized protein n=1 Tax=Actinocatenispora rupis TaxID=519421 RepID=A0A8J3JAJ3_9ACTN|nr:hypothetical protein Aru02nite_57940 [Actinocatenispora rupis]
MEGGRIQGHKVPNPPDIMTEGGHYPLDRPTVSSQLCTSELATAASETRCPLRNKAADHHAPSLTHPDMTLPTQHG